MKLLFFTLLCILTILLLRRLRAPSPTGRRPTDLRKADPPPAASPDEIVDVRYEDCGPVEGDAGTRNRDQAQGPGARECQRRRTEEDAP